MFRIYCESVEEETSRVHHLAGRGEGVHGTNAVAVGSNEGSATIETDVGKACHKGAVLEPAQAEGSSVS